MNTDKDYSKLPESLDDIFGKVDSDISDETIENAYLRLQSRIHGKKRRSLPRRFFLLQQERSAFLS